MKRLIIHWTVGTYKPNAIELADYHFLVTETGEVVPGKYKPEDNENVNDGVYARHCGGGNTGSIGVAMCGMYVPKNVDVRNTKYPLTKIQCERMFKLCADLCKKYDIPITPDTVMTHYEFGQKHPKSTSHGKIDITYLPAYPQVTAKNMGDFIRGKIIWYSGQK